MKRLIIYTIVLSCAITLTSCGSEEDVQSTENIEVTDDNTEEKTEVVEVKSDVIKEMVTYSGTLSDIKIHMTLKYFDDNRIEGAYYYDKYKEDISLVGEVVGDKVTLNTVDGSEEFVGTRSGDTISGEWKSGDKTLDFSVTVENEKNEVIGKSINNIAVTDGEYLYYSTGNYTDENIYRCKLDGGDNEIIESEKGSETIDIVDDKIYYVNSEYKLSRMDKDGGNKEQIFSDQEILYGFIIYNDRIYFDNEIDRPLSGDFDFKLMSVDLDGNDYQEVILPEFKKVESEEIKSYYLSNIYKDKAYFISLESGPDSDIYRIGLDGSNIEAEYDWGYILGIVDDNFYNIGINSSVYFKKTIDSDDEDSVKIFEGADTYRNTDTEDEYDSISENYFVYNYSMVSDEVNYITVMDLDGNILNEVEVPKMPKTTGENDYDYESLRTVNIGDYIYIIVSEEITKEGYVGRFKAVGGELEVLTEF